MDAANLSTTFLATQIESGVLTATDFALLQAGLEAGGVQDEALFGAIEAHAVVPMNGVIAQLLRDPKRADLLSRARLDWRTFERFAEQPKTEQIFFPVVQNNSSQAPAELFASNFPGRVSVKRKEPVLRADHIDAREVASTGLPEIFKVWNEMTMPEEAVKYPSLTLQLPFGVTFRYGEFKGEGIEGEPDPKGTIIDFGNATCEQIAQLLFIFKPEWFGDCQKTSYDIRRSTPVRFILPEDFAQRLVEWGYRLVADFYDEKLRGDALVLKLYDGGVLTEEEKTFADHLQKHSKELAAMFYGAYRFFDLLPCLAVGNRSAQSADTSSPIGKALHDISHVRNSYFDWFASYGVVAMAERYKEQGRRPPSISPPLSGSLEKLFKVQAGLFDTARTRSVLAPSNKSSPLEIRWSDDDPLNNYLLRSDSAVAIALSRVLSNLFSNTLRYSDPDKQERPRATVQTRVLENGSLFVTVTDNGIGIERENLIRLGESGFQEKRKAVEGSRGVGLSSVVQNLSELGSPLLVKSEAGKGTTFGFIIRREFLRTKEGEMVARQEIPEDVMRELMSIAMREKFYFPPASNPALSDDYPLVYFQRAIEAGSIGAVVKLVDDIRNELLFRMDGGERASIRDAFSEPEALDFLRRSNELQAIASQKRDILYRVNPFELAKLRGQTGSGPNRVWWALFQLLDCGGNPRAVGAILKAYPDMEILGVLPVAGLIGRVGEDPLARKILIALAGLGNEGAVTWANDNKFQNEVTTNVSVAVQYLKDLFKI